jgi:hypothetical protein
MDPLTLGLLGGTSLVSAGLNFLGSQNQAAASREASNQQTMMQALALQNQMRQQAQLQENISPYLATGSGGANLLTQRLPELTSPITMDQATLERTPGYQFNLQQGLKATQNAAAARGLGVSGAALKGAASYATGLADNTYQNQFNNAQQNQANAFNRLYQTAALGSNAATGAGTIGQSNANSQSSLYNAMGQSQAAGTMGAANANYNALTGFGQPLANSAMMYAYYSNPNRGGAANPGLYGPQEIPQGYWTA